MIDISALESFANIATIISIQIETQLSKGKNLNPEKNTI